MWVCHKMGDPEQIHLLANCFPRLDRHKIGYTPFWTHPCRWMEEKPELKPQSTISKSTFAFQICSGCAVTEEHLQGSSALTVSFFLTNRFHGGELEGFCPEHSELSTHLIFLPWFSFFGLRDQRKPSVGPSQNLLLIKYPVKC